MNFIFLVKELRSLDKNIFGINLKSIETLVFLVLFIKSPCLYIEVLRIAYSPGFKFNCIDGLVTNFHLPKSSLLILVSSLLGLEFTKTINYKNNDIEVLSGQWSINNQGICLDYTLEEYEDECYDTINFENNFFDCENNTALCEDNFAYFISKNNTDDKCSKESYELPIENMTLSKQEFLNFYDYFPAIIKNAIIITTK